MDNRKKVLLYGYGDIYQKNKYWIATLYDIIGVVDRKFERSNIESGFYTIKDGVKLSYDYILVTTVYIDEIKKALVKKYCIPEEKIIFFLDEFSCEKKVSFGEKNPNVTFFILRAHWQEHLNGFYNFFNRIVRAYHYTKKKNYELVVDMKNYYTEYATLERYGKNNVWEQYYMQPSAYTLEEVYQSKNVILSKFGVDWGQEWIGDIFQRGLKNYEPYVELGQRYAEWFCPGSELAKSIECERKRLNVEEKKILGVLMRGTDFKRHPKNHPVMHDTREVIKDIHGMMNNGEYDVIYLATEDSGMLKEFIDEFNERLIYTNQYRTERSDTVLMNIHFDRKNDGYLRGMEYCTVIELLSQCRGMIANCLCGGTMAALMRNAGKYKDVIIYDDGMY